MKVLKNFSCNGVRKQAGQSLTAEEKDKIGQEFGKKLIADDFLQRDDSKPVAKKEAKEKKEVKTKK